MSILGQFGGDKMCFKNGVENAVENAVYKTIVCRKLNVLAKLTWYFKKMDCKT